MNRKKLYSILLTLSLLFHALFGFGLAVSAAEDDLEIAENILTDLKVTIEDDDKSVTYSVYGDPDTVDLGVSWDLGASVRLDYDWALPDGHDYENGSTFTFDLPEQFLFFTDLVNRPLVDEWGEPIGTFDVYADTNRVVMTFTDIEGYDGVSGSIWFSSELSRDQMGDSTEQRLEFDVKGEKYALTLRFKPVTGTSIDKEGYAADENGDRATFNAKQVFWTVDVNTVLDSVYDAGLTDPLPEGLKLDADSVAIYPLEVRLDGSADPASTPLDPEDEGIVVTAEDDVLEVLFGDITSAYRIQFTSDIVDISDKPELTFDNEATFAGSNLAPVDDSALVRVERGQLLEKDGEYDPYSQTIQWTIKYNFGELDLGPDQELNDWFSEAHVLDVDSFTVYEVSLDNDGNYTKVDELTEEDYTLTDLGNDGLGKNGFQLAFDVPVTGAYVIEYVTAADGIVRDATDIVNEVESGEEGSAEYTVTISPLVLEKFGSVVDYGTREILWTVKLYGSINDFDSGVVLTDSLGGNLRFLPETLSVKDDSGNDVTVTNVVYDDGNGNGLADFGEGFDIEFAGSIDRTVTITYKTEYQDTAGGIDQFRNVASLDWTTGYLTLSGKSFTRTVTPNLTARNNGYKNGDYDTGSKTIQWEIGVNYNGMEIVEPILRDPLQAGQRYVDGSVVIRHLNVTTGGGYSAGDLYEVEPDVNVVPGEEGQEVLVVEFGQPIDSPYVVTFQTTYEGALIEHDEVTNTAQVLDGADAASKLLTAEVPIKHGGEHIFKEGNQNGAHIDWTIYINRGQSYVEDAVIYDEPTPNQLLDEDSFVLYDTAVASDGTVTAIEDTPLVEGVDGDYRLEIHTDEDTGAQTFELFFNDVIDSPYILEYRTLIDAEHGEEVGNSVSFSGRNTETVTKESSETVEVRFNDGGGTGSGVNRSLKIVKTDADDDSNLLAGAKFRLDRYKGDEWVVREEGTTDEDGELVFDKLVAGQYRLTELEAPVGYELNEEPETLLTFLVTEVGERAITVTNKKIVDPGGEDPGGEDPGGEDPGGEDPGGEDPGGEDPGGEDPGGEDPGGEDPGGEDPGGEDPGGEDPGGEDPGGEDPGGEDPGGEDPGGEDPGGEDPGGEDPDDRDEDDDEDRRSPRDRNRDRDNRDNDRDEPSDEQESGDTEDPADEGDSDTDHDEAESEQPDPTDELESDERSESFEVVTQLNTSFEGTFAVPEGLVPSLCSEPEHGIVLLEPNGNWTYVPEEGFVGQDNFCLGYTDEQGNQVKAFYSVDVQHNSADAANQGEQLPKTGEMNYWPIQAAGIALIAASMLFIRKRRIARKL